MRNLFFLDFQVMVHRPALIIPKPRYELFTEQDIKEMEACGVDRKEVEDLNRLMAEMNGENSETQKTKTT